MLCGAIGRAQRHADAAGHRAYADNMPATRLDHVWQQQLGQPDRGQQIHVDDLVMHVRMGVERQTALADSGIIDENVDPAFPVARFLDLCR